MSSKASTDASYNSSVTAILSALAAQLASPTADLALSVVFGTHNEESCKLILHSLETQRLATRTSAGTLQLEDGVKGRVSIAQLYGLSIRLVGSTPLPFRCAEPTGMKDDLTERIASTFTSGPPVALKVSTHGESALRKVHRLRQAERSDALPR